MSKADKETEAVRKAIRDAMDRLLAGNPIRSDGKLTIKSLASEAKVKRWVLTHQHTDLQSEFRLRCDNQGKTPANQQELVEKHATMKNQIEKYKAKLADTTEENHRLTRIVQVLTLENLQLKDQVDKQPEKISHLR